MSEHLKRPLYVIGAGDLGTSAADIESNLGRVFDVATIWKAIVLIDEVKRIHCNKAHSDLRCRPTSFSNAVHCTN
jgi:hypothetical protein